MATTGIWKIGKRLDHVIDYITNVEKTMNEVVLRIEDPTAFWNASNFLIIQTN